MLLLRRRTVTIFLYHCFPSVWRADPIKSDSEAGCLCLYLVCETVFIEEHSLNLYLTDTDGSCATLFPCSCEQSITMTSYPLKSIKLSHNHLVVRWQLLQEATQAQGNIGDKYIGFEAKTHVPKEKLAFNQHSIKFPLYFKRCISLSCICFDYIVPFIDKIWHCFVM